MDKYKDVANRRMANKKSHGTHETHPEVLAQQALSRGKMASKVNEDFFTEAYGEVLVDLFMQWLQTQPHETKTREFLYSTAMGLGSVKEKLIQMETFGKNIDAMKAMEMNNE